MFGWLESRYWKITSIHLCMPPFSKPSYPKGKQVTAVSSFVLTPSFCLNNMNESLSVFCWLTILLSILFSNISISR